ncbi:hypothetical protein M8J75_009303 [Diaphorina citri]|nr:hypothetical protein M8J75_009303 [Diaphorina citri]
MGNWALRVSVWFVAIAALVGNLAVLLVLISSRFRMTVPKFLMCNLAFADFCMGLYLIMIAIMDVRSIGDYFNHAIYWQRGMGCQMAGFLTVFSSVLSIFTLTVITCERWYTITYAIHLNRRLKLSTATKIMVVGWVYSIAMAALPLFDVSNYSKTSICLPMKNTNSTDSAYLIFLLLFNGLAFWMICACYARMYSSIRGGTEGVASLARSDMTVARRMALLVFTDFACWAPIAFFGLTALAGYPLIDVPKTKILLVFFYPLNSCANPYLYALLTQQYRRDFFILLSRYGICSARAARYKGTPGTFRKSGHNAHTVTEGNERDMAMCGPQHRGSLLTTVTSMDSYPVHNTRYNVNTSPNNNTEVTSLQHLEMMPFDYNNGQVVTKVFQALRDMSFDSSVPPPSLEGSKKELPSLLSLNVEPPAELLTGRKEDFGEEKEKREVKLPVALEQALAFKSERAKQIGVNPEDIASVDPIEETHIGQPLGNIYDDDEDDEEEDTEVKPEEGKKKDKNQKTKRRKKKKKRRKHTQPESTGTSDKENKSSTDKGEDEPEVEIEYIQETLSALQLPPMYRQFAKIFEAFKMPEPEKTPAEQEQRDAEEKEKAEQQKREEDLKKVPKPVEDDEDMDQIGSKSDGDPKDKMSKRKMKKLTRLSVAELKQLVHRPDVVEMHDVTARDPKLLVQLKAYRNTVPVPRHWCFKRKYLQGKRGIEKPPFNLPEFIKKTGIMEMRASLQDKEEQKTLKSKMRERVRPKLGKIDIDYQKLHDAFFKWQTKPRLSIHGDLYYEGKEFETKLKEKKPGDLSAELRTALGMPVGPTAHKIPPPWLIAMQRYGPPPSYPNLKIPGLNAPIPQGCSFGYHAGGWGKPPVDETGKPLYGDVFGTSAETKTAEVNEEDIEKTAWGELESESEEESEEDDEEEEEEEEGEDESGLITPAEGLMTPSGITSVPAGLETPDSIELRKKKIESDMETNEAPQLFQVLTEKRPDKLGPGMMASTHMYEVPGAGASAPGAPVKRTLPSSVELALDPSELDLVDTDAMAARYEQQMREQTSGLQKEDLSDMLAEHVARQKNKRKRQQTTQDNKQAKKYKEFKF